MPSLGCGHAVQPPGRLQFIGTAGAGVHLRRGNRRSGAGLRGRTPRRRVDRRSLLRRHLATDGLFDARWLDAAVPDRPVVLRAWDYHTAWCNSVALDRAGITADTPDPVLGEIPRREDGSVLGTLREWGAVDLMTAVMPQRDEDVRVAALGTAADYYLARGVTWVQDAWVEPADVDTYVEAARRGALRIRFNLGLYADPRYFDAQLAHFAEARRRVEELGSDPAYGADGEVLRRRRGGERDRCAAGTVLLLAAQPRHAGVGGPVAGRGGAAGRRPRTAGSHPRDRRRRSPAGAGRHRVRRRFATARATGGRSSHTRNSSTTRDIDRFARLGVIANMQPLWAQMDALMTVLTIPRLGAERADRQYRMRTIDESGARLAFGSDWPVSSGAPLDGLAVAVSRRTADGEPEGGWTPAEILTIERALIAGTAGVAEQAYAEGVWGQIAPGASADLVWLDRDPRITPPLELPALRVRATYLQGRPAYSAVS